MAQASDEAGMNEQKENCCCAYGRVGGKPRARYECTVSLPLLGISTFAVIHCEHESQLDRFNRNIDSLAMGSPDQGGRCCGKVYQESKTSMREAKSKSHVLRLVDSRNGVASVARTSIASCLKLPIRNSAELKGAQSLGDSRTRSPDPWSSSQARTNVSRDEAQECPWRRLENAKAKLASLCSFVATQAPEISCFLA